MKELNEIIEVPIFSDKSIPIYKRKKSKSIKQILNSQILIDNHKKIPAKYNNYENHICNLTDYKHQSILYEESNTYQNGTLIFYQDNLIGSMKKGFETILSWQNFKDENNNFLFLKGGIFSLPKNIIEIINENIPKNNLTWNKINLIGKIEIRSQRFINENSQIPFIKISLDKLIDKELKKIIKENSNKNKSYNFELKIN